MVSFGSSGVTSTPGATTLVLQPGIYLVQLSVFDVALSDVNAALASVGVLVNVVVNGNVVDTIAGHNGIFAGPPSFAHVTVNGNAFLQISAANTVVGFNATFSPASVAVLPDGCQIVFTRLQ
jgi:hypothetical protein